jgi:hypothetical protein
MEDTLREKLLELKLTEEQVDKLAKEEVMTHDDMSTLTVAEIQGVTGCTLMRAKYVQLAFVPAAREMPVVPNETDEPHPIDEIPEGTNPSPDQVNTFATNMGIDQNMLSMFLFAGVAGGNGMDFDISNMMPIPQIVAGYNPKIRNMPYMIMGQIEKRLGTPIVIINEDGAVNPGLTVRYIMDLEEGFDPTENDVYYDDAGQPYQVIRVGVDAQSIYDADPMDSTRALPRNGIGIGRINWTGVATDVRQVVYFAASVTHELDARNDAHTTWLRDHIKPGVSRLELRGQCPNALTSFNEANRTGSLPTLRVMLSRSPRREETMPRRRRTEPRDLTGLGRGVDPDSEDRFRS